MTATRSRFADGRWHLQHGPIDLIIEAHGDVDAVASAHEAAWLRFATILQELVAELRLLRERVCLTTELEGVVARRMWQACRPHRARFVTPMAAVAGSVADELIACYRIDGIDRAWVNNGGDIALHLAHGASASVGLFTDLARFDIQRWQGNVAIDGAFAITYDMPVRGVATSGWRGRSFSLGIADSVTVLAATAAEADSAATMIANAVDVVDARVERRPASSLKDDSDLGDLLVTVDVPSLDVLTIDRALYAGLAHAEALQADGVIAACILACQGRIVTTAAPRVSGVASDRTRTWHSARLNHDARLAA
jgi:uncharacterized protein